MKKLLLLPLLSVFTWSCSDDDSSPDTTKPIITISAPTKESKHKVGSTFKLQAKATDNKALKSVRIDIHLGAGHAHKMTSAAAEVKWDYDKTITVSGTEYNLDHSVTIPSNTQPGEYHILVYAVDKANNEIQANTSIDIEK